MKYYIIAGEASGDLHASNLMFHLKQKDPEAQFRIWGGDKMEAQGGELVKHYRDLAFMGFIEVLVNLRTILRNIRFCKEDILHYRPDVLILVDYPGFNLRIAKYAFEKNLRVFYYISPQIWAWKKNRVYKIKKYVERMYVILPFEQEFYKKFDVDVDFVGHPLLDAIEQEKPRLNSPSGFRKKYGLDDRKIIALLPGSRKQEISKMLPVMLSVCNDFPDYQFVVAGAPSIQDDFYRDIFRNQNVNIIYGATHDLLHNAFAGLVTSGTATLETALLNLPQVVCYKGSNISFQIAKRIVDIKYISLVNLIMDREVVKELIQSKMNHVTVKQNLKAILAPGRRDTIFEDYAALREKLGGKGASEMAADLMLKRLSKD